MEVCCIISFTLIFSYKESNEYRGILMQLITWDYLLLNNVYSNRRSSYERNKHKTEYDIWFSFVNDVNFYDNVSRTRIGLETRKCGCN